MSAHVPLVGTHIRARGIQVRDRISVGHDTSESRHHSPRICGVDGCLEDTRQRKPFCTIHIARHPYVASLLAADVDLQMELDTLRQLGRVWASGRLVSDWVAAARDRKAKRSTVGRIGKTLGLTPAESGMVARAASKAGLVRLTSRPRSVRVEVL